MIVDLKTKFENIDVVFKAPGIIFMAETTLSLNNYREFNIKYLKDNNKEIDDLSKKINALFSREAEDVLGVFDDINFKILSEKMELLSEELEDVGSVKCYLKKDVIRVEIYFRNKLLKEFTFKEEEYLDSLLDYLKNDYKKIILKG